MDDNSKCRTVFVTVGTTSFERLIRAVVRPEVTVILTEKGYDKLILQNGSTLLELPAQGDSIHMEMFAYKDSIQDYIEEASLVVSHAGAGSIFETLAKGKPLLVVINEDLMDNHQIELAERLEKDGFLYVCTCRTLEKTLKNMDTTSLQKREPGDPKAFGRYLDRLFQIPSL